MVAMASQATSKEENIMGEYNGWTNRATWAVALHVNNDQGWQEQVYEIVRDVLAEQDPIDAEHGGEAGNESDDTIHAVSDRVKDSVTEIVDPETYVETFGDVKLSEWLKGPGMAARDIGDLDEVNWYELAESFIRDVRED